MGASRATRRWRARAEAAALALAALALAAPAGAQSWRLGGDVRYYQFLRLDDPDVGSRRDAELGIFRLKADGPLAPDLVGEAHAVLGVASPPAPVGGAIAAGTTRRFFDLEATPIDEEDVRGVFEVDRLAATWQPPGTRLVIGRQAITWGVSFFWPVLDLFAPFPPERIDREYKPGMDAVRLTKALGRLSEVDVVAAGQGKSLSDNGSVGALARISLGAVDVGAMAGSFHGDVVAGGFVTANVRGTGLRGEAAWTDSDDPLDAARDRARFWRATAGVDRQLTPALSLTAELAWNGFGSWDPAEYTREAAADRVRRGEVASLGKLYTGGSLGWQVHPLLTLTASALVNLGDGSALLLPHGDWSLSDSTSLVFGGVFGVGSGRRADGSLTSEYGAAPQVLYGAIKFYF